MSRVTVASAWARVANVVGGVPDRLMTRIPDFMLHRSDATQIEYVRRLRFYERARWDDRGERFLQLPDNALPTEVDTIDSGDMLGATREVLRFGSTYLPRQEELRAGFRAEAKNQQAYVQLFHHGVRGERPGADRPLVVCVHGFGMGAPSRAIRMFRVQRLLSLGVDVALFTLPCHWRRNAHHPRPEQMLRPQDLPFTIELLGQALHDLHCAITWLGSRGYTRIGLIGASLGGYLAGLYTSFHAPLSFIFMVVPAIDLTHFLMPRASLFDFPVTAELRELSRDALQRVAPLHQPAAFDPQKICVVAHQGDRICPVGPIREFVGARGITNHVEVVGGHWAYLDRDVRGRTWYGWLAQHGFIRPRGSASDSD